MRVAVDGYEIRARSTGVGRVIENILGGLLEVLPEAEIHVLTREPVHKHWSNSVVLDALPVDRGYFWWQNGPLARRLRTIRPDVLLASNYTLPWSCPWRSILFEYDVSFAAHPEWYPKRYALAKRLLVQRSLERAAAVVTISEFSKKEIIRHFKVRPEKVEVIPCGIDDCFYPQPAAVVEDWKAKRKLQGKTLIGFLGSVFNRRNLPQLVESVRLLRQDMPAAELVVVGRDLTHPPQAVSRLLDQEWIRWDQSLANEDLPVFYSSLGAFAFLSEYEGFGLPPLEALACGTVPVLLKTGSLEEVYQGMAVLVDEPRPGLIKEGLSVVLRDSRRRQVLLETFAARRGAFSWPSAAQKVAQQIRELTGDKETRK